MGVLTDLFIADESEAEKLGLADDAHEEFTGIDIKGLDYVPMSSLYSILDKKPHDSALDMIFEASEEGPWVIAVPDGLTELLSDLKGKDTITIANEWNKIDELRDWESSDLNESLQEMAELANQATQQGKGLLMWMCL